jgi:hypothetical protein
MSAFDCPHCSKTCKTLNGLRQHVDFKHPGKSILKTPKPKKAPARLHNHETLSARQWIEPSVSENPSISEMIAVSQMIYAHYSDWAENAVSSGKITPEDGEYRCRNALDVLRLLRWFKENEDAIKARAVKEAA